VEQASESVQGVEEASIVAEEAGTLHARPNIATPFVPLQNDVEIAVASVWCELLGLEEIGSDDAFFDLGGHSLLATQLISRLRDTFGVEMPLKAMFEVQTLAEMSQYLVKHQPTPGRVEKISRVIASVEAMAGEQVAKSLQAAN
jgi:acyl carrier protein